MQPTAAPRYLPALDGLRALAVLLVLWCHVPPNTSGYPEWLRLLHTVIGPGGLGVELFFVLSGFLITRILLDERQRGVPVRWFLLRRTLRIFPIYYLLLLVMWWLQPRWELAYCALYLGNLLSIQQPYLVWPLGHTWSLCIEEHFYLLWPLLVAFCQPRTAVRCLGFLVMPGALLCAIGLVYYLPVGHEAARAVEHASPVRFLSLAAGSMVAFAEGALWRSPRGTAAIAGLLVAVGVLLLPILQYVLLPHWTGQAPWFPLVATPLVWLLHSVCFATGVLLLCVRFGERQKSRLGWLPLGWLPLGWLTAAPLRGIGRISYGLYLYHLPIYHWLVLPQPTWPRVALALAVTGAVACTSYLLLERPLLRFAARYRGAR